MKLMKIIRVAKAGVTHPFGDARTVQQAFPSALPTIDVDPFLMCDYFDMVETVSSNNKDPNHYPVDWHPHRGFDIASYLKRGVGRHADSLGNRETFATPGMQWMSTGSGVMHAEGGGDTIKGQRTQGFQIWVNVPAEHKMDDPEYGTVTPDRLPAVSIGYQSQATVLAGQSLIRLVPFKPSNKSRWLTFL
jgi:redox-sensitive bicupin YhaK (pirin superfamily)